MKAVVVHSPGEIRWEDVPDPIIPEGWVKVAVKTVGVCSSDIGRALHGAAYHYPIVLGHEIGGIVSAVGPEVSEDLVGRRVAVSPLIPCGKCEWCENGRYSMCDDYDYLGSRRDGGCAEIVIAPERNLIFLPDNVSMDDAGVMEPASVTLHGLDKRVHANDDVVVLGAGNLGLFALQQAQILGARRVFVIDLMELRLKIAEGLGAIPILVDQQKDGTDEILKFTHSRRADLVVDTCGVAVVQASALGMVRKGGRIVYMGTPHKDVCISPKNFNWLVRCEVEISGSWNSYSSPYPGTAWQANLGYLSSGKLKTAPIITHHFAMKDAEKAYRLLDQGKEDVIKVLLFNE
jgi:L-iditol 2-dehydrogenase